MFGLKDQVENSKLIVIRICRKLKSISLKIFITLWLIVILLYSFYNYNNYNDNLPQLVVPYGNLILADDNIDLFSSYDVINSTVYSNLFLKNNYLFQFLVNFDFEDRCEIYFNEAYHIKDEDKPIVDPNQQLDFNGDFFKPLSNYIKDDLENVKHDRKNQAKQEKIDKLTKQKIAQLKEEKYKQLIISDPNSEIKKESIQISEEESHINPDSVEVSDDEIEFDTAKETEISTSVYNEFWIKIKADEQSFHNFITHTKIFNKCFLNNQNEKNDNDLFIQNQQKVLKKLKSTTHLAPPDSKLYKNCRTLEQQVYPWITQKFPTYFRVLTGESKNFVYSSKSDCFLNSFYDQLSGRGLVITLSNDHASLFIRLLHVLKTLGNTLPIELLHKNDLTQETFDRITNAVKATKQDVWYVNMSPALTPEYEGKFDGYGNKIIASLFNSFQEMMLIDADTVLMKSPETFFRMKKYVEYGTLFFKDRTAAQYRSNHDLKFFDKLFNSQLDEIAFNLPRVSNHTMNREFFSRKQGHYMESGVVLVDRYRHFHQPLIMALLIFYTPITHRVYGDKELFWLSLAFYGDEQYEFNDNFAAAIGEITIDEDRFDKNHPERKRLMSKEICSNHPAHISDEDNHTLLWFNSGFKHCGQIHKVDFNAEFGAKTRYSKLKKLKQFEAFFKNKLLIRQAIIPPHKVLTSKNGVGEPNIGWYNMREYCAGYTWCGYSSMGYADESKGEIGTIIHYSKDEQKEFDRLGDVWIKEYKY